MPRHIIKGKTAEGLAEEHFAGLRKLDIANQYQYRNSNGEIVDLAVWPEERE